MTDSLKISIGGALIFFACLGSFGVFLLARELKIERWFAQLAAISFVFTNFAITNWLVGGLLSQYSAMMIVPWFMFLILRDVRRARFSVLLGICLGLMFLAHSVLSYMTVLISFAILVLMCCLRVCRWSMFSFRGLCRVVMGFTVITAWWLLPMLAFKSNYDISRLLPDYLAVMFQFHSLRDYVWDKNWSWLGAPHFFTVQLDIPVMIMVLLLIAGFSCARMRSAMIRFLKSPGGTFVSLVAIVSLLLQYRRFAFIYEIVPGADFIQFPWRLSALVSAGLVVLVQRVVARAWQRTGRGGV